MRELILIHGKQRIESKEESYNKKGHCDKVPISVHANISTTVHLTSLVYKKVICLLKLECSPPLEENQGKLVNALERGSLLVS